MTIYVVTAADYGDYYVVRAFRDLKQADAFALSKQTNPSNRHRGTTAYRYHYSVTEVELAD